MTDELTLVAEAARELGVQLPDVHRADVGGVSSLVWGASPSTTFLHGAALNAHTWDATILRLQQPAVALDLPGHGDSEWREDFDYSPRTMAPAVIKAIEALTDRPQRIVGQSLGGLTALAVAELRPDLLESLVLVDVSPGIRADDAAEVRSFLSGPLVFDSREQIAELAIQGGIAQKGPALDRGVVFNTRVRDDGKVVFKHHFGNPPEGAQGLPLDHASLWPVLENLEVPVTLIRATRGYLSPAVVEEFRERVPNARIVEIDALHNVQDDKPDELAQLLTDQPTA